jgi:hypothetical protein
MYLSEFALKHLMKPMAFFKKSSFLKLRDYFFCLLLQTAYFFELASLGPKLQTPAIKLNSKSNRFRLFMYLSEFALKHLMKPMAFFKKFSFLQLRDYFFCLLL